MNGWVSVEDRLPKPIHKTVLVYDPKLGSSKTNHSAKVVKARGVKMSGMPVWVTEIKGFGSVYVYPTHWMPLPEPPEEDV